MSQSPKEIIREAATRLGFDLVGFAAAAPPPHLDAYRAWLDKGFHGEMAYLKDHLPLKGHPESLLENCRSVIAVGLNYNQPNPKRAGKPQIARYALGRDYHKVLRSKLNALAKSVESEFPLSKSRACVDSAPIMERDFAQLAGLGWYGKNTMIINSRRGSWFFIGLLLTTAEIEPDHAAMGGCGSCTKCIDACPTGAIVYGENHWQVDARKCISYQTIENRNALSEQTEGWTFGCDICQEVCPFNEPRANQPERAVITSEPDFLNKRTFPSLVELAQIDEHDWDMLTRGSAVRRTGIEGLRRNAQANLNYSEGAASSETTESDSD